MAKTEINPAAAVALDYAMDRLCESASPWRIPPDVWEQTWNAFAPDFNREITNLDQWLKFKPSALRLAKYIGTFAAFLAETEAGATGPIGDVEWEHIQLAIALVKIDCPPPRAGRDLAPGATLRSRVSGQDGRHHRAARCVQSSGREARELIASPRHALSPAFGRGTHLIHGKPSLTPRPPGRQRYSQPTGMRAIGLSPAQARPPWPTRHHRRPHDHAAHPQRRPLQRDALRGAASLEVDVLRRPGAVLPRRPLENARDQRIAGARRIQSCDRAAEATALRRSPSATLTSRCSAER